MVWAMAWPEAVVVAATVYVVVHMAFLYNLVAQARRNYEVPV